MPVLGHSGRNIQAVLIPGETVFDRDVLALDKAGVLQTLTKSSHRGVAGGPGGGLGAREPASLAVARAPRAAVPLSDRR